MIKCIVYKITNDIDSMIYIGCTKQTLESRFLKHISDSKWISCKLHEHMIKIGIDHFEITEIKQINVDDRWNGVASECEQSEIDKVPIENRLNMIPAYKTKEETRRYMALYMQERRQDEDVQMYEKKRWTKFYNDRKKDENWVAQRNKQATITRNIRMKDQAYRDEHNRKKREKRKNKNNII